MAELPGGPTFPVPEPPPPPPAAEPPPPAPPPWTPGGWNDPRGMYNRDGPQPLRWGPILVFGALFLVLGGILVALFLVPSSPPRPAVSAVTIWKYNDPALPPNPWAKRDGERIVACFPEDTKQPEAPAGQEELIQTAADLRGFVAKLSKQKSDRPYVCYLSALASISPTGVAVLSPVAGPDSDVGVAELLDELKKCPAKEKLLILDLAHPLTRAVTGPFRVDPAEAVHDAFTAYGPLPCPVIVSCSRGEVAVPMDPEGSSAFAFYLVEGLRGGADGSDEQKPGKDGRVTLRELYLFTARRTARWASQVRGVTQTPWLYDAGCESVNFTVFIPSAFPERAVDAVPNPMPAELAEGWVTRDTRKASGLLKHPLALAVHEGVLLRAEVYWRAGDVERARTELSQPRAVRWLAVGPNPLPPAPWEYPTLAIPPAPRPALADKKDQEKRDEADAAVRTAVLNYWRKLTAKPEKDKEVDPAPERESILTLALENPVPAAQAVWAKLRDEPAPTDRVVRDVSQLMDGLLKSRPPVTEQMVLRRLSKIPEDQRIEPKAMAALIAAEDAAGQTLAVASGEGFPAVAKKLEDADRMKRHAEAVLWRREPEPGRKEKDDAMEDLKRAWALFAELRDRADAVRGVRVDVREALWLLAATAPAAGEDAGWFADWKALADTLNGPVEKVFAPAVPDDPPEEWRGMSVRVRAAVGRVRKRITDVTPLAKKVAKEESPEVSDVTKIRTALLTSALPAADRALAWDAVDKAEAVLHKKVREGPDATETGAGKGTPQPRPAMPERADGTKTAAQRAAVSLALARLGGFDLAALETGWQSRVKTDGAAWTSFSAEVKAGWAEPTVAKQVNARMKTDAVWPGADRLSRCVAPPVAGLLQPENFPGLAPADRSGRATGRAADGWLEQHFRAYQLLRPGTGEFYPTQAAAAARRVSLSAE